MAKNAFNKRRESLSKRMIKDLGKNVIKTVVWSFWLYGSASWTLRKYERDRFKAYDLVYYKIMI